MNDNPNDSWQRCPPGELHRTLDGIRTRQRRWVMMKIGSVGAGVVLVGLAGYAAFDAGGSASRPPGGLACSEVAELMPRYRAKRLPEELRARVATHLSQCPECRRRLEAARG